MKKTFTLIELLIVVIIIGVLVSLAVPMFARLPLKAKAAKARSSLATLMQAEKIYKTDNNNNYINVAADTVNATVGETVSGMYLAALDNDPDWNYSVNGSIATATKIQNPCGGDTITLNMDTNVYTTDVCFE